ncbi:olfactory receptor 1G1-like [Tachyglossus aculeatus]|uniref:olfactory receptor 1G1-like n=1 Tax=Tachyglossus aculeatus TaxID=9261 RepID=UPI0018F54894|nr:olfactory receptor 1G1-like [Tachyglossus aculeatus]
MDGKFLKDEAVYCDHAPPDLLLVLLALQLYHFPMGTRNQTSGSTFTLQSIANAGQQRLLFVLFLGLYLVTVVGNLLSVLSIRTDYRLHSPTYFFLANLSLMDIGFSSTTVPSLLGMLFTGHQDVSYSGCLAQLYFSIAFGVTENFLLAVMAYDHYLAICSLLRYSVVTSPQRCVLLVVACWLVSHLQSLLQSLLMTQMTFCPFSEIPLFFCDVFPLLKISCADPHINLLVVYTEAAAIPSSSFSSEQDTIATVIYTMITPLLNPLIYSLYPESLASVTSILRPQPYVTGPGDMGPEEGRMHLSSTNYGSPQGSTFTLFLSGLDNFYGAESLLLSKSNSYSDYLALSC